MTRTRTGLAALAAAATSAALLSVPPATAAPSPPPTATKTARAAPAKVRVPNLVDALRPTASISPNGDKVKDRARIPFRLKRKSVVTVKVYRAHDAKDSKLLFTDRLGRLPRGRHNYRWNGRKPAGKLVRDNRYQISFVADPVKQRLEKAADYTTVYVDTRYTPEPLQASSTIVYPNTTVIHDQIAFNHGGSFSSSGPDSERVRKVTLVVTDSTGSVVRSVPQTYGRDLLYPVPWDGRSDSGAAVPAGAYTVRMEVIDLAGNKGISPAIDVTVSAAPLVLASGTRTTAPAAGPLPPAPASDSASAASRSGDGRTTPTGGDDTPTEPCGTVFASSIYPDQGASFRSRSKCTFWSRDEARASNVLRLRELDAPRGLQSVQVSMRGRPTFDGEVDTARIGFGPEGCGCTGYLTATSSAVTGETVTTPPALDRPWDATGYRGPVGVEWTIVTVGFDSYDVADVTASFTYLTPQP